MPAYGTYPNSKSVYPGQDAIVIGYPAQPGGPSAETSAQNETVVTGYKSIPVCIAPAPGGIGHTQRQVTWQVKYGTAPSVAGWTLQGAIDDVDADYVQVDTAAAIAEFVQTQNSNFRFFRILAGTITGACAVIAKITGM